MAIDRRRGRAALLALILLAPPALAAGDGEPLSAIDWLSNSVDLPPPAPASPAPDVVLPPPDVTVTELGAPVPDRAGLVDARELGVDPGIWGRSSARDLAAAIAALPDGSAAPPSLRRFLRDLMVLRLDPPIDAALDDSLYLARLDRLLAMGHLDAAGALIEAAGAPEPQRFRRAFDIALLTGTETEACRVIEATPEISPTYPVRIFCLARLGQWDVAALTLGNAEALGILTPEEDQLLLHFLDPDLFEGDALPPEPALPSPLVFRLYEAIGERIATDRLPVAFARADLHGTVGWKTRLRAAERLAANDALSHEALRRIYFEREPAASGGIWDRVEALQELNAALAKRDTEEIAQTLPGAWEAAREAGYHAGFAHWAAPRLASYELNGTAGHLAFEIALIAGDAQTAARFAADTREDRFLMGLARAEGGTPPGPGALDRAVLRGLAALGPGAAYEALIADGRKGEALLRAVSQLMDGAAGNPDATANSLALLRALGLGTLARQIAVELVLMEGQA